MFFIYLFCHEIIIEGASNIGDTGANPLSEEQLNKQRQNLKEKQDAEKKKKKIRKRIRRKKKSRSKSPTSLAKY